jgi:hypothetical protein
MKNYISIFKHLALFRKKRAKIVPMRFLEKSAQKIASMHFKKVPKK